MTMSDTSTLVHTIALRWNTGLAEQAARQIAAAVWAVGGQPDQDLQDLIEHMRQVLKQQLGRTAVPTEQIRLLETSYRLEQGMAKRKEALNLAKNLRHLSERKADVLHQVRSASMLSDAWHWASEIAFAIDWSRRALQTAKPMEVRGQGGRPLKAAFVAEELHLAWLMALQGGADESVDKLMTDAVNRYNTLKDRAGQADALGLWSQVRMLQGRWAESADLTRQSLAAAAGPRATVATALWAGARSASRAGDLPAAQAWIEQALDASRSGGDISAQIAARFSQASILLLAGDDTALAIADQAVALADAWKMEILRRWAMLERSWLRLAAGQSDTDETRATVESFARSGAAPLEAEARYALYHALRAAGQDGQAECDKAREQFAALKMSWHLDKADRHEPLLHGRNR
jgi:hypothetical protein